MGLCSNNGSIINSIVFIIIFRGLNFETKLPGDSSTVKGLIMQLYEKASIRKSWWLVRHTAGMLSMKHDDLAKSLIIIIVRQKQVSIGIPIQSRKNSEINITK